MGQRRLRKHALEKFCGDFQLAPCDLRCESLSWCIPNVVASRIRNELPRFHRAIDLAVHTPSIASTSRQRHTNLASPHSQCKYTEPCATERGRLCSFFTHTRDASFDRLHTAAYTAHTELGPATCRWRAYVDPAENKIVRCVGLCVKGLP